MGWDAEGEYVPSVSRAVRTLLIRVALADVGWPVTATASATASLSVAAAGEVAGTVESMGLVSILAAAEAAASDAMDCGLILKGVLDTGRRRNCRLTIGVKNEGCSTAAAGPMSVNICAQATRTRPREHGRAGG